MNAPTDKRSRLIHTALQLVHEQGFRKTTLADIARRASVPLGNVYYYFKTKDEIGEAIVEQRLMHLKIMLQKWDRLRSPKQRLEAFVQMTVESRKVLANNGCPVGTFCSELHKEGGALAEKASALFREPLAWIETQFCAVGKASDSRGLAIHLLSALQGISVLANTFQDSRLVVTEASRLKQWIRSL